MPGTESKGSPIEGNPATEDLVLSVSSADKDQKLEETPDKVASRSDYH